MIDPAPRYFSDPTHPVWSLLRVAVMTIALVAVLKFTASKFDEIITVCSMFLVGAGGEEGTRRWFRSHKRT